MRSDILSFLNGATGLRVDHLPEERVRIHQLTDGKFIDIDAVNLDEVLFRADTDGRDFIQVNFCSNLKILITDTLIGFKPSAPKDLELTKLPRVVTTPDVVSVFEAIQDALHATSPDPTEILVLKKIYEAVLRGGESVGFDLSVERSWLARIPSFLTKVSA